MSPILDLQRRIREAGRIRMGDQVGEGRARHPRKLEHFRMTSTDRDAIERCAAAYGGEVTEWADAPGGAQWQCYTDTDWLDVFVPPGDLSFSQWYELWNAGGCTRRCDGRTNYIADGPCECDATERECVMTTRLSVMLREVEGLGVWRAESHGYYAATEMAGIVDLLDAAATKGHLLPAVLRLDPRTIKRVDPKTGKPLTRHFVVPTLDVRLSVVMLLGDDGGMSPPGDAPALSSGRALLTPVPPPERPESPSVAEALANTEGAEPSPKRAGSAPAIRSTGRRPRKTSSPSPEALADQAAAMAERAAADAANEPEPEPGSDRALDIARTNLAERLRALPPDIAGDVRREWPALDLPTLRRPEGWTPERIGRCESLVKTAEARALEDIIRLRQECATMARNLGWSDDERHAWVRDAFGGEAAGLTDLTYPQLVSAETSLRALIDARAADPF